MPGKRVLELVTNERSEKGEVILSEEKIIEVLQNHRTIKRWAYIMHDKDVYTADDEKRNPRHKAGSLKKRHWHIVMHAPNQVDIESVAKWFFVEPNMIDAPKGRNAFFDKIRYLTHESEKEQKKGKYRYPDDAVHANFDWRLELKKQDEDRVKYGSYLSPKDQQRYDVMYTGKILRECQEENRILYMNDVDKLKKCRLEYLINQEPPRARCNIYICGSGGSGKGLLSRALARNLYPRYNENADIYFSAGAKGAAYEGYDGQPVIIWDDRRAVDLLMELNGRGNVFAVFDTFPTKQRQNIKYGSVNLCNIVNIVNSVQPYDDFLDSLSGEYMDRDGNRRVSEDTEKGQSYRRFPIIIVIDGEYLHVLINRGFLYKSDQYLEYIERAKIKGNMRRIAEACAGNEILRREMESNVVQPIIKIYDEIMGQFFKKDVNEDEVRRMLSGYGTIIKDEEKMQGEFTGVAGKTPFDEKNPMA